VIRAMFRLAVIVSVFTIASLANTALSWHLPLPDLLPNTAPTPPCVLPGSPAGPPASTTAYGQPAGFGAVIPDLPSAMGKVQGELLHKLDGPPPTQAQLQGMARAVGSGAARWFSSLQAAANGKDSPAQVTAYQERQRAAFLAQNATSCNPCNPRADGSPDPSRQASYSDKSEVARRAAVAAGFTGDSLAMALEVARLESGFVATAANPHSSARGVWQVMLSAHQDDPDIRNWADPNASARMAWRISRAGTDWSPWTTAAQARRNLGTKGGAQPVGARPAAGGMECAALTTTYKTGAGVAWGPVGGPVYGNGRIPLTALAHPAQAPTAWFRPDAAAGFDRLSAAYAARFGHPLRVTDSYRDYAHQVSTKAAKPGLAAEPGTSNHGWGLAADIVVGSYSSADYLWLRANGPRYGWDNPTWARQGGSRPEKWHWDFTPPGAAA
jgi:hypothetical protein